MIVIHYQDGVNHTWHPSQKSEEQAEKKTTEPASENDRDRWEEDAKEISQGFHGAKGCNTLARRAFNFERVIFDDWIGEQVAADGVQLGFVAAVDLDFHEFADAHGGDRGQSVVVDGITNGDSLGVEHALFGHHNDLGFHEERESGATGSGVQSGKTGRSPNPDPRSFWFRAFRHRQLPFRSSMLPRMFRIIRTLAAGLALLGLVASAQAQTANESAPLSPDEISSAAKTDGLSIPTPGELMAALNKLGKPDWSTEIRPPISMNFGSRAQMALNLGGLIADGYIAVEAEDAQQVKNVGKDIMDLAKPLSVHQDILNRGKSITDFAEKGDWNTLKEDFEATQNEVKLAMAENKDQDLVTLVTLGGWIRGLEVISDYLSKHYTPEGAKLIRQPAIVRYLSDQIMALPKKLQEDGSVKKVKQRLTEIQTAVSFPKDGAPALDDIKNLNMLTGSLMKEISKKGSK